MPSNCHTSTSPVVHMHDWQRAYESVLLETEKLALFKRIEVAEAAILTRRDALYGSSDHHSERKAIEEALARLRFLKHNRLGFGDPER